LKFEKIQNFSKRIDVAWHLKQICYYN
jgi:hypothetical protein